MGQVDRIRFVERLQDLAAVTQAAIYTLALMTNHAHLLELKAGSRRKDMSRVRVQIVIDFVEGNGLGLAEAARNAGVTTSAKSKIIKRTNQ